MRVVHLRGKEFHIADNLAELQVELRKKFGDLALLRQKHHIKGRQGVLALCVENIYLINWNEHKAQKSLDPDNRAVLDLMVRHEIGEERWEDLSELENQIKLDPTYGSL